MSNSVDFPADPLGGMTLAEFGPRLRQGAVTIENVTEAYLARIERIDPRLGAYEFVATEAALKQAKALDQLLAAGTDLGPLMGIPVAVKDVFAVAGMPTRVGSMTTRMRCWSAMRTPTGFVECLYTARRARSNVRSSP